MLKHIISWFHRKAPNVIQYSDYEAKQLGITPPNPLFENIVCIIVPIAVIIILFCMGDVA